MLLFPDKLFSARHYGMVPKHSSGRYILDVILFGVGQLAETLTYYLDEDPALDLIGYTVDRAWLPEDGTFCGRPVVAWDAIEDRFPPDRVHLLGPISYRNTNLLRYDRYRNGKDRGYRFTSYVHPSSHVGGARLGENTIVLEECTVQPHARLGHSCILWSKVHIGHHARIGDACFLASFCGIAGNCDVGERTFFGGHTGLADNLSVGSGCIIGAGTVLTSSLPDGALAAMRQTRVIHGGAKRFASRLLG